MKALTAYRNAIKRYGDIESTEVSFSLLTDDEMSMTIRFKVKPNSMKGLGLYGIFKAARNAATKLL
jgi:hypothetical protein